MPETNVAEQGRVFSEEELVAITADRVTRETAELTSKVETLEGEKTDLGNKLDVETAAREAAEQKAAKAETDLQEFKDGVEAEKAAAARKDERLAKVREAASHLPDSFFEDDGRVARITAMSDEAFEGYVSDIRDTTTGTGESSGAPRETAMQGDKVTPSAAAAPAAENFLNRSFVQPKGA